jgi:hypothetical protein
MVQVDKFIKSTTNKSKANKLVSKIKKIQALDKTKLSINTYKKKIYKSPIPTKPTKKNIKTYIAKIGINTVSPIPLEQKPTKLDLANLPIIQPSNINITNMEPIKVKPNVSKFENKHITPTPTPTPTPQQTPASNDYIIVIPSFNRPDLIQIKTLALLHRHNINPQNITIFVANQEQYDLYKAKVPNFLYGRIVIGVIGLKNQRNFIMEYYPEGMQIVQMDDDLDKIVELVVSRRQSKQQSRKLVSRRSSVRKTVRSISNLDEFIRNAFRICKERKIYLWGVYPLSNARFMTPTMTTDLRFIVGPMWGIINRHRPELKLTIDEKENAERTLQHWVIDHAVIRFNNIGIETKYYKNKGGMQNEGKNRKEEALKSVYYLHKKYPQITKIYLGKKSGMPEIRMLKSAV